uniref:Uncharacterized protein n=1 Tax=Caenorhabditis japonica TaxID=281687 RepID=A0A8R1E842_CAEJA
MDNSIIVSTRSHYISWKKEADHELSVKNLERKDGGFVQAVKRGFGWTRFEFKIASEIVSSVEGVKKNGIAGSDAARMADRQRSHHEPIIMQSTTIDWLAHLHWIFFFFSRF